MYTKIGMHSFYTFVSIDSKISWHNLSIMNFLAFAFIQYLHSSVKKIPIKVYFTENKNRTMVIHILMPMLWGKFWIWMWIDDVAIAAQDLDSSDENREVSKKNTCCVDSK